MILYEIIFVRPSHWIAEKVNTLIDNGLIDGILHAIAKVFVWLGNLVKVLNSWLIDGVGDGIPEAIYDFGGWLRRVQTGRIQQYMLLLLAAAVIIGLVLVLSSGSVIAQ